MAALVVRSAQLQEELNTLQEKYEVEIENHIRDSSDREELVIAIQKLTAEKNDLKHHSYDLQEQLRAANLRICQLEKGVGRLRSKEKEELLSLKGCSIKEELADIKKELLACGVEHY
jgi:chromosome segregation ATPase